MSNKTPPKTMLEIIAHRQNQLRDLDALDTAYGAEIDIRSRGDELILAHDPFSEGDSFERYLDRYAKKHVGRLLIVNTKEDGHEETILKLLKNHGIERFFFLDTALPTLVRLVTKQQEHRVAVRVSEYESPVFADRLAGLADWVWLDCFQGTATALDVVKNLKRSIKICLVSPELQGYPADRIDYFSPLKPIVDAVCTKYPARWR